MDREADMEKECLENIDRILAGKEVKISAAIDNDYRTALDFTQKMVMLRAAPSPSFKTQLKERLLSILSEEEEKVRSIEIKRNRFWEALGHLVPRQPVWRAVTATALVIILAAIGVLWQWGEFTQPPAPAPLAPKGVPREVSPPTPAPAPPLPLEIEAIPLSPIAYAPAFSLGEEVKILFVFKNISSESITVAPFLPRIEIRRRSTGELVRSFPEGSEQLDIPPVETVEYTLVWDQKDDNGKQVAPGWCSVSVNDFTISKAIEPTTRMGSWIRTKILIQLPQGAMEKVIEVNQSQTVSDLTITLERVELSAMGAKFYAFTFTIPPDYSLPPPPYISPPPRRQWMFPIFAQYTVNGVTKDAGRSSIGSRDNGVELVWGYHGAWVDPVPSDAQELTFTITRFGELEGPWEFKVPLE